MKKTENAEKQNGEVQTEMISSMSSIQEKIIQAVMMSRPGYDKVPKHASIACRQQTNFISRDIGKKLKEEKKRKK